MGQPTHGSVLRCVGGVVCCFQLLSAMHVACFSVRLSQHKHCLLHTPTAPHTAPTHSHTLHAIPTNHQPTRTTTNNAGLSIKAQATLLELLEAQGLPQLCVTMATKDDASRRLGEVMAEAVKVGVSGKASTKSAARACERGYWGGGLGRETQAGMCVLTLLCFYF